MTRKILCTIYVVTLAILVISCKQETNCNDMHLIGFRFPFLFQTLPKDSPTYHFEESSLQYSDFVVAKKSDLTDSIKLKHDSYMDSSIGKNFRETVDKVFENNDDSLSNDGLELFVDYSTSIYRQRFSDKLLNYYPFYLFNGTTNKKRIRLKDQQVYGIQEALDSTGNWHPIEYKGFDFCGNGSWNETLNPNQYLVLLAPKYKGNYKTKLRIRLQIGDARYISKSFEGCINYTQFFFDKKDYYYTLLQKDVSEAVWIFYGATPMQIKYGKLLN